MLKHFFLSAVSFMLAASVAVAQSFVMDIDLKKQGPAIQATQYGIFFEDINFAADGGLFRDGRLSER